jgi:hypothetical protein
MSLAAAIIRPTLREGDRLTAAEFLRRWEAMPELKHAELIGGIVFFMPSPVSASHSDSHFDLALWLGAYRDATPGCQAGLDCTWKMGPDDVAQPDLFLRLDPEYGGQSRMEGNYAAGAPELIVEVSGASTSRDLGVKLNLYRRSGVREYLTVLLKPKQVIWRQLARGRYREMEPDEDGLLRSHVFPGLWLDPAALGSSRRSIRTAVERGLKSEQHAAFVQRLVRKSTR